MNVNPNSGSLIQDALRSVPLPPRAVHELLRISQETDVDMQRIVDTITSDEALTARVMRVVNSALFGLKRRVSSVQQATVLLGKGAIAQIAVGVAALHMETETSPDFPLSRQAIWRHSMGTAFLARQIGQALPDADAEEAFTAGLLHDIGKLVLMGYLGPEYSHVLKQVATEEKPLNRIEREILDVDHDDIGRELCTRWKLSPSFQEALSIHHDAEAGPLKRIIQVANAASKAAQVGRSGDPYVALARLPDRELRHMAERWAYIRDVSSEVVQIEQAFRLSSGADEEEPLSEASPADDGMVLVQVSDQKLEALLMMVLGGLGYQPQVVASGAPTAPSDAQRPIVASLTDEASGGEADSETWLNVADWRAMHHRGADHDAIDVMALRTWIADKLEAVAPEEA